MRAWGGFGGGSAGSSRSGSAVGECRTRGWFVRGRSSSSRSSRQGESDGGDQRQASQRPLMSPSWPSTPSGGCRRPTPARGTTSSRSRSRPGSRARRRPTSSRSRGSVPGRAGRRGTGRPARPSTIVVTARQSCFSEHGHLDRAADASRPARTPSRRRRAARAAGPWSSGGGRRSVRIWSPPPITSQRYHRAPASHAAVLGRNHAQLRMVRIARLSSAPVKSMNSLRAGAIGVRRHLAVVVRRVVELRGQGLDSVGLGGVRSRRTRRARCRCSAARRRRA